MIKFNSLAEPISICTSLKIQVKKGINTWKCFATKPVPKFRAPTQTLMKNYLLLTVILKKNVLTVGYLSTMNIVTRQLALSKQRTKEHVYA